MVINSLGQVHTSLHPYLLNSDNNTVLAIWYTVKGNGVCSHIQFDNIVQMTSLQYRTNVLASFPCFSFTDVHLAEHYRQWATCDHTQT